MEQNIIVKGINLAYTKIGSGPAAILMHGWGCDSSTLSLFQRVASESHTVYNLDLPGFGKSDEPSWAWTVEDYTQMLEEFVTKLGIERPVLLGHSFGGRVAILYSSRNAVDKLVLVDAAGVKPKRSLKYYMKVYSFKLAKKIYPFIVGRQRADEVIAQMRATRGSSDYNNSSETMRQVLVKAVNTDLRSVMPRISAPTLLLWGENDTATPMRDAHIMRKLIPGSGLVSFAGAGHFCFIDNPYQSAATVRRFLQSEIKK